MWGNLVHQNTIKVQYKYLPVKGSIFMLLSQFINDRLDTQHEKLIAKV